MAILSQVFSNFAKCYWYHKIMKKVIYNKIDKRILSTLPPVNFTGKIIVIQGEQEAERAVEYLMQQEILGVDTETRPSFSKGVTHKVSLLQVASRDICFLFRLNMIGLPDCLIRLLENNYIPMIGLSWNDDLLALRKRREFKPGHFIDLQKIVGAIGIEDLSLQKLYANVFGEKISKRQRLSNWDHEVLNDKQKTYAAIDAWACIQLYEEIARLITTNDYHFEMIDEPEVTEKHLEE